MAPPEPGSRLLRSSTCCAPEPTRPARAPGGAAAAAPRSEHGNQRSALRFLAPLPFLHPRRPGPSCYFLSRPRGPSPCVVARRRWLLPHSRPPPVAAPPARAPAASPTWPRPSEEQSASARAAAAAMSRPRPPRQHGAAAATAPQPPASSHFARSPDPAADPRLAPTAGTGSGLWGGGGEGFAAARQGQGTETAPAPPRTKAHAERAG